MRLTRPATARGRGHRHREVSYGSREREHAGDIVYFLVPIP